MFPEAPSSDVMVVTVTQKTENDMTSWCMEVEQEREQMLDKVNRCLQFVLGRAEADVGVFFICLPFILSCHKMTLVKLVALK